MSVVGLARVLLVTTSSILSAASLLASPRQAQAQLLSPNASPAASFYVSFPSSNDVGVFDPNTLALETIIPTTIGVQTILVDQNRPIVYFTDGETIQRYSTEYRRVNEFLKLPLVANSFVIDASGERIYALSGQTIVVVGTHDFHILNTITLPFPAVSIAASDKFHFLFAAEYAQNRIAIIDTRTQRVIRDKDAGYCVYGQCDPYALAVSPDQSTLLAVGNNYLGKKDDFIAFDIGTEKRFAQCESRISEGQYFVLGVDPSVATWWFGSGRTAVGISMSPPCEKLQYFNAGVTIGPTGFSPAGQGIAGAVGINFREPNGIVSFPNVGSFFAVWSAPASVAWVP